MDKNSDLVVELQSRQKGFDRLLDYKLMVTLYEGDYEKWVNTGIALGIVLLFILFRKLVTKYVFQLILKLREDKPNDLFIQVFKSFEKPISWLFIIIGLYIGVKYFPFINQHNPFFLKLLRSMIIFLITWGLFNLSSPSQGILLNINEKMNQKIDLILIPFISRAMRVIIVAISISIIGQEFDYDVNGLVAGLGLGGLAFALAAKDAVGNLIGGIVIVTEKPFSIGDWILTSNVEGTVEDINFRSTKVRTFSQALVTVPNATLASDAITNWSRMGKRKIDFHLDVAYQRETDQLDNLIEEIKHLLRSHQGVHQDTIVVAFDQFKDHYIKILVYFFTNTTAWEEHVQIKHQINLSIMQLLEKEGISLAVPMQKVSVDPEFSLIKERSN
ncbi:MULTISPECIES: mechanosensitive ion channel family protein [Bacillaceae]|nr:MULTISPECIES: mechanosensitive ion channel family protein [Bacillaceae]